MAEDIAQWLEGHGLGQYARPFANNGIDMKNLVLLTDNDLKELGHSCGQATMNPVYFRTMILDRLQ